MNFQRLLNDLLTIKSHAESIGMSSKEIAELKIVEKAGLFGELRIPDLEFMLAENANNEKCILFKNVKLK